MAFAFRLFRKPAPAFAADVYRDGHHVFRLLIDDGLLSISDRPDLSH
jgi:hypothetical protein